MLLEILFVSVFCNAPKVYAFSGQIPKNLEKPQQSNEDISSPGQFSNCYENLGCISTTAEWFHSTFRPRNLEPLDRHTIRTQFIVINKDNSSGKVLKYDTPNFNEGMLSIMDYRRQYSLIILIHDFTSNGYTGWIKHMAAAYLRKTGSNIISVDWEAGAEPPFEQAIANARVVGLEIIQFVSALKKSYVVDPRSIHIIAHGVGAHIAGYVGSTTTIGRITGLDPTGPFFEGMPNVVRLDPTDAMFVEVLHTDASNKRSQGAMQPFGHFDFYANGAKLQPGCNQSTSLPPFTQIDRNTLKEGNILPACSHKRSFKYFIESLESRTCEFTGFRCKNYEDFTMGKCVMCNLRRDNTSCATFGLVNAIIPDKSYSFFLNTNGATPFCMNPYKVRIYIEKNFKNSKEQKGYFEMIMMDSSGNMVNASATNFGAPRTFEPDKSYASIYYASPPRMHDIVEVRLKWYHKSSALCLGFCTTSIYVKEIKIKLLSVYVKYKSNRMCPSTKSQIPHGSYSVFKKCGQNAIATTSTQKSAIVASTTPGAFQIKL